VLQEAAALERRVSADLVALLRASLPLCGARYFPAAQSAPFVNCQQRKH
jgi:hypothetical protein